MRQVGCVERIKLMACGDAHFLMSLSCAREVLGIFTISIMTAFKVVPACKKMPYNYIMNGIGAPFGGRGRGLGGGGNAPR